MDDTQASATGSKVPAEGEHDRMVMQPPLAKKHNGMRISASGILQRVGGQLKFGARQMDEHLKEMAARYYAGDIAAVDEFLQLYALDGKRPAA